MQGDKKVMDYLNKALRSELTAVSQYWLHYRLQEDWGFGKPAAKSREESIECAIGEQVIGGKFLDQFRHRAEVMRLPWQQAEIDKVSKRVGEGQYLGRDAAA